MVGRIGRTLSFHDDTEKITVDKMVNLQLLQTCTKSGLMGRRTEPALQCIVHYRTRLGVKTALWNPVTLKNLFVVDFMTGQLIARSFDRILPLGDKDFPEAWRDNWPQDIKPVVTEQLDGWQAVLIYDTAGNPQLVGPYGRYFAPYVQGLRMYTMLAANKPVIWPMGYTPVFEIVSTSHMKCIANGDRIYLVAIVNNRTGHELDYKTVREYAAVLNMHTPTQFVSETAAMAANPKRGYVLRFDFPERSPLRIKVESEWYVRCRSLLEEYTPAKMVEHMKKRVEDPYFRDSSYPLKFRFWAKKAQTAMTNVYANRCLEFCDVWKKFPHKWNPDAVRKSVEYLNDIGKIEYSKALLTRLRRPNDWGEDIWELVAKNFSEQCYFDSVTGGDSSQ